MLKDKENISIKSQIKNYKVFFEESALFIETLAKQENSCFVIDEKVWELYKKTFLSHIDKKKAIILSVNEDMKTLDTVQDIYKKMVDMGFHRSANLIVIGGGILQDIAGFVAATIYRGISLTFVPTTLLAQVDACIGGKNGVNFDKYKNLIGTIYPPSHVYILSEFIKSLSDDAYYSGIGEIAKMHLISGYKMAKKFQSALPQIDKKEPKTLAGLIRDSLVLKKIYIEADEQDFGKRNMLNYGHCFGHAVETVTDFKIPHGQAVVMGMILANNVATLRGLLSPEKQKYICEEILRPILKVKCPKLNAEQMIQAMNKDKKNTHQAMSLIMIDDEFHPIKVADLAQGEIRKALSL